MSAYSCKEICVVAEIKLAGHVPRTISTNPALLKKLLRIEFIPGFLQ